MSIAPLLRLLLLLFAGLPAATAQEGRTAPPAPAPVARAVADAAEARAAAHADWNPGPPEELFEVVRVVDGDTLHIRRQGELQKLRLLSVDTEEKLSGNPSAGGSKPETVYGQASADWAVRFFADLADEDGVTRVGLLFPEGVERRDVYGRVLCHVVLADGTDFNLALVALGRSPYFNKYGDSLICEAAFRRAQARARAAGLGIWDPEVNRAREGAPSARRPYEGLLPWWEARARAVAAYRAARAAEGARVAAADAPEELEALLTDGGEDVRVFGTLYRVFEESDGGATLLFRTGESDRAVRARVPAAARERFDLDALDATRDEFRQNYLWVTGDLRRDRRGFDLVLEDPTRLELAGPEPAELDDAPPSDPAEAPAEDAVERREREPAHGAVGAGSR